MITYVAGNLFESPAHVLVNTVNTVGVMGKGIAKEFKRVYPDMFKQYQLHCDRGLFKTGQLWLYKTPHKWILNFPTKQHWRQPSKLEYIEAGLQKFVNSYAEKGVTSIAFPALGCGNGELNWESEVRPVMERYLKKLPIEVFIYLYQKEEFTPEHRVPDEIKAWLNSQPASLSFEEFVTDLAGVLTHKQDFTTLVGNQPFSCISITDVEGDLGLELTASSEKSVVENWQLIDLWHHIRGYGLAMDYTMPSGLEHVAPFLVTVLSQLPYLRPVRASKEYSSLKGGSVGLQLIVPTQLALPNGPFEEPQSVRQP